MFRVNYFLVYLSETGCLRPGSRYSFFGFYTFLIKYIATELSVILRCTTSSIRHHHALLAELMHEA